MGAISLLAKSIQKDLQTSKNLLVDVLNYSGRRGGNIDESLLQRRTPAIIVMRPVFAS